ERNSRDPRGAERKLVRFVEDDLVRLRIPLKENLDEERGTVRPVPRPAAAILADHPDLPEDQRRAGIEVPVLEQETGRFVTLAPALGRVETDLGEEQVLGRDGGVHRGRET